MVYLLADWGMGDSEICNRNYADKSSHDLLRIERDQQHRDDEVDLHPLSNQVIFKFKVCFPGQNSP